MLLRTFILFLFANMAAIINSCSSNKLSKPESMSQTTSVVQSLWEDVDYKSVKAIGYQIPLPSKFRTLKLNSTMMKEKLSKVILLKEATIKKVEIIQFPLPEGGFSNYSISEAQTMDAALLEKFPELRTYGGQGIDEPTASAKIDFNPSGFHGYFFTLKGSIIIEPFTKADTLFYLCYYKQDSSQEKIPFESDSLK